MSNHTRPPVVPLSETLNSPQPEYFRRWPLMKFIGFGEKTLSVRGFEFTIEYAENPTAHAYRPHDPLDLPDRVETYTACIYPPRKHAVIARLPETNGQSENEHFTSLGMKLDSLKESHLSDLHRNFCHDGTNEHAVNGLQNLITEDGMGKIGGIEADLWGFWQNQFGDARLTRCEKFFAWVYPFFHFGKSSPRAIEKLSATIREVLLRCTKNDGTEGYGVVTDFTTYNALRGHSFGVPLYYDEALEIFAPGRVYILHPDYLQFVYPKGEWMKLEMNEAHTIASCSTIGQLCVTNRQRLGVVRAA